MTWDGLAQPTGKIPYHSLHGIPGISNQNRYLVEWKEPNESAMLVHRRVTHSNTVPGHEARTLDPETITLNTWLHEGGILRTKSELWPRQSS